MWVEGMVDTLGWRVLEVTGDCIIWGHPVNQEVVTLEKDSMDRPDTDDLATAALILLRDMLTDTDTEAWMDRALSLAERLVEGG